MTVPVTQRKLTLPVTLAKQENPRSHSKVLQRLIVLSVIIGVLVAIGLSIEGRLRNMVGLPLLILVWRTMDLYLPGCLSYELREGGVYLRSALRRRTIAYDEIELAAVFTGSKRDGAFCFTGPRVQRFGKRD